MLQVLGQDEYQRIKNLSLKIQGPIDDNANSNNILKNPMNIMVDTTPPKYQFDFDDDNFTFKLVTGSETYQLVVVKTYYGQLVAVNLTPQPTAKSKSDVTSLKQQFEANGFGLTGVDIANVVPLINVALQKNNSGLTNTYWTTNIDYDKKLLELFYGSHLIYEIDWDHRFYFNQYHAEQSNKKTTEKNDVKLTSFPYSYLLELNHNEYQRVQKVLANLS